MIPRAPGAAPAPAALAFSLALALAVALPSLAPGCDSARAGDEDEERQDEEGEVTAEDLLRALIRETRGVRDAVGASRSGQGDIASELKAIRAALTPREIKVVALPVDPSGAPADAAAQTSVLERLRAEGFRLVAVSEGYAYLQK